MISILNVKEIAKKYVKENLDDKKLILEPIFRLDNNQLYIGFLVTDFYDEENNDYRIKRPMYWLLSDMETGEVKKIYNSEDYDYTDTIKFPLDLVFLNDSHTVLFDYNNFIMETFNAWKRRVRVHINGKIKRSNDLYNKNVLRTGDKIFSINDYYIEHLSRMLDECKNILKDVTDKKVDQYYYEYCNLLIDEIREQYIDCKFIDIEKIEQYLEALKYGWPDQIDIINKFNNVFKLNSEQYDNELKKIITNKQLKETEKNNIHNVSVEELISKIDEKISKLENEQN